MDLSNQEPLLAANCNAPLVLVGVDDTSSNADDWPFTAILPDRLSPESNKRQLQYIDTILPNHLLDESGNGRFAHPSKSLLVAALGLVIAKHTAQERITIDVGSHPTHRAPTAISNYRPLLMQPAPDVTFTRLHEEVSAALPHLLGDSTCRLKLDMEARNSSCPRPAHACTDIALCFSSSLELETITYFRHDVTIVAHEDPDGNVLLRIFFNKAVHGEWSIQCFATHLRNVLKVATQRPATLIREVSLLEPAEARYLLNNCHRTNGDYPVNKTIAELFSEHARRSPDAVVIESDRGSLTYRQLDIESTQLANFLQRLGVGTTSVVPVLHSRSPNFLVAILAILKAGGIFLPIDPKYPADRVASMFHMVGATIVITESALFPVLSPSTPEAKPLAIVATDWTNGDRLTNSPTSNHFGRQDWHREETSDFKLIGSPKDPAYIVFTSGSTGVPKGVVIRNEGAVNHIFAEADDLALGSDMRFLQTAQLSTDLCVWQFLAPPLIGGTCVVSRFEEVIDGARLFQVLRDRNITIVELVPAVLRVLLKHVSTLDTPDRKLPNLRWMMVTGESVPVQLINHWLSLFPDTPIVNAYGPSEVSDDTAQQIFTAPLPLTTRSVPVGKPLTNLQVLILDSSEQLVPIGVPGEICVTGIGVADGYWENPITTQRCFVPNPYAQLPTEIMYKTGDLGRRLADGNIELLGRADDQVKIRGFRIELGEIESVLGQHNAVNQCLVMVREDVPGKRCLVAYLVPSISVNSAVLRDFLLSKLPDYMVPSAFVFLDAFPLTANGVKINRRSLPPPTGDTPRSETEYHPPETHVEEKLVAVWCDVLGLEKIGVDDNFFALGGDSMQTVEMTVAAEEHGVFLPAAAVFDHPTISELAQLDHKSRDKAASPIDNAAVPRFEFDPVTNARLTETYGNLESLYPPSPTQLGIYLSYLTNRKDVGLYIEQISGFIDDADFDVDAFKRAWLLVIAHHPSLRTIFIRRGLKKPLQAIRKQAEIDFFIRDETNLPHPQQTRVLASRVEEEVCHRFQLDQSPLTRVVVSQLGKDKYHVIWTYPHILMDGWSESIVLAQVLETYDDIQHGVKPKLPQSRHYLQYIEWLSNKDLTEAEAFWRNMLKGFRDPTPVPFCTGQGTAKQGPAKYGRHETRLPPTLSSKLQDVARHHGWTVNTILQGGWSLLLARFSGLNDVLFGVAASGRQVPFDGVENVVGLLVNSIPFRIKLNPAITLREWLNDVQKQQFRSRRYEFAPYAKIAEWSDCSCKGPALFSSYFVFANYPDVISADKWRDGLQLHDLDFNTLPEYPLTVFVQPGSELLIRMIHDERYFSDSDVRRLLSSYQSIILDMIKDLNCSIGRLQQETHPSKEAMQLCEGAAKPNATPVRNPCQPSLLVTET